MPRTTAKRHTRCPAARMLASDLDLDHARASHKVDPDVLEVIARGFASRSSGEQIAAAIELRKELSKGYSAGRLDRMVIHLRDRFYIAIGPAAAEPTSSTGSRGLPAGRMARPNRSKKKPRPKARQFIREETPKRARPVMSLCCTARKRKISSQREFFGNRCHFALTEGDAVTAPSVASQRSDGSGDPVSLQPAGREREQGRTHHIEAQA